MTPASVGAAGREPTTIRAAGGVVWRPGSGPTQGHRLVCLVHRPRYDDWSLPKGKLLSGEHPLTAAVREVREETGVRAVPQLPLPPSRYQAEGGQKTVDYWAMAAVPPAGPGTPLPPSTSEVDAVAWLPVGVAAGRVTHRRDAELLRQWELTPPVTGVVLLVRHADAGVREGWPAADAQRPLSAHGRAQAAALCRLLDLFAPARLVSAAADRCQSTLSPLARSAGLPVTVDPAFNEEASAGAARQAMAHLAGTGEVTVVCSQRAAIPPLLAWLDRQCWPGGVADDTGRRSDWPTDKGDGWLLPFSGPTPLAIAPVRLADGHAPR